MISLCVNFAFIFWRREMENHLLLAFTFEKDFCLLINGASSKIIQFAVEILISQCSSE
jgi:hypothetical protein